MLAIMLTKKTLSNEKNIFPECVISHRGYIFHPHTNICTKRLAIDTPAIR